jgi:hypothetical protein
VNQRQAPRNTSPAQHIGTAIDAPHSPSKPSRLRAFVVKKNETATTTVAVRQEMRKMFERILLSEPA